MEAICFQKQDTSRSPTAAAKWRLFPGACLTNSGCNCPTFGAPYQNFGVPFFFGAAPSLFTPRSFLSSLLSPAPCLSLPASLKASEYVQYVCPVVSRAKLGAAIHRLTATMDIVLEIFDTFLFDRIYSTLLPALDRWPLRQTGQNVVSSTFSSLQEGATMVPQYSFQPASKILSFQPSEWAYQSAWPRNNIYRQAISLFLVTWSASQVRAAGDGD